MNSKIIFNNRIEKACLPPMILSAIILSKSPFSKTHTKLITLGA